MQNIQAKMLFEQYLSCYMGLIKGTEMKFIAEGSDALEAIKALIDLVDSKFGSE